MKQRLSHLRYNTNCAILIEMRHHLSYANVMSTIAVFVVLGGGAYAAVTTIPGPDGVIHGCYQKAKKPTLTTTSQGLLRVVPTGKKCLKSEVALQWNQKGNPGLNGTNGAKGDT